MPREFLVILDRLDGRIDGSALGVTKDKYKRRSEHGHGVLEAGERIDVREIARYAAYEEVSAARIESILRSDARVCAPQDSGEGILSERQRGTLGDEIVALHSSFNVAIVSFQETFERGVRRQSVLRFGRRTDFRDLDVDLDLVISAAQDRPKNPRPIAAAPAILRKLRRPSSGEWLVE